MKTALSLLVIGLAAVGCSARFGPELHKGRPIPSRASPDNYYRLPTTATPNYYNLSLTFGLGGPNPYVAGEVIINLDVDQKNDNHSLILNSNVTFAPDAVATWQNSKGESFKCTITPHHQRYIVLNCTGVITGKNQTVTINYTPYLSLDDLEGAYVSRFNENGAQKYIVATQFEEISARRVFPSFDEPEFKAPITLTLITNNATGYSSRWVANTKERETSVNNGVSFTTFEETPAMSTYLLAFVITQDFQITTSKNSDYEFSVFTRESAADYVTYAMKYGQALIDEMGKVVNIPYASLGNIKMTFAAIPEFTAGAMENWGLITFRESYLIDEGINETTERDIQGILSVIAHELTHQWFGDYVTFSWWSDTWLNEGFAQFFQYYLIDQLFHDFEMMQQLITNEQQAALKADAYPDAIPLSNNASNVTTEADLKKEFGTISYSKGASIIKLIKCAIGEKAFLEGLTNYLTNNQYKNTESADLITALQNVTDSQLNLNLTDVLESWIFKSGYPIVEVSLDDETNNVTFDATRFSSSINKDGENTENIWHIPLSYTTSENTSFSIVSLEWLNNLTGKVVGIPNKGWIIVNLQSAGFYRVNYDETLWNRLIKVLIESCDTIDVVNRAQLLDDVFNIARSKEGSVKDQKQNYLRAFALANYLKNEIAYHPWYTFFVEIQYLLDRIQDDQTLSVLKENVTDIVSQQADIAIATANSTTLTRLEVLKNNLLLKWSCKLGYKNCVQWAQEQFENYKENITNINNNYRDVILCTGFANSINISRDYNFLLDKLDQSNFPGEQNDLAMALTCINNKAMTNEVFQETLKEHSFPRMLYPTILAGLISDGTEKLIWTLKSVFGNDLRVNEKWEAITSIEEILATIAAKSYSTEVIDVIQNDYVELYDDDYTRASIVKAAKAAIEIIKINTKWVDKYGDILTSVIVYNGGNIPTTTPPPPTKSTPPSTKSTKSTTPSTKSTTPSTKSTTPRLHTTTAAAGIMSQNVFFVAALVVCILKVFYC